jgi:hypothetical protein
MMPRVIAVTPKDAYTLNVCFSTGEDGEFDISPYLDIGVFKELKDVSYFRTVTVKDGTIVWPNGQDLCPDTIYDEAHKR